MNESKQFLRAAEAAKMLDISLAMAYRIIRQLNDELKAEGYITVAGRVNRKYLEKKIYNVAG